MERKEQQLNLIQLITEYRNKGRALRGYKALKPLLTPDNRKIFHLLRDHEVEGIELDEEVDFRDNVDFLLKFYAILEIAIISGYVHPSLNPKLQYEISHVLGHVAVRQYYQEFYPLLLPEILFLTNRQYGNVPNVYEGEIAFSDKKFEMFNSFLLSIKSIENDKEVEQFQWFLDGGHTYERNIDDLNEIFSSKESIGRYFMRRGKDRILTASFFGYIKYVNFLVDYKELLDRTKNEPLLQSAMWHYHAYWFKQIKNRMAVEITSSLIKLNSVILESSPDNWNMKDSSQEEYLEWRNDSSDILDKAIININALIKSGSYELPLKKYLSKLK